MCLFADGANVTGDGKLNILGMFSRLYATAVPATHPHMVHIAVVVIHASEAGTAHRAQLVLVDEDGKTVGGSGEVEIRVPDEFSSLEGEINIITPINLHVFPRFGRYRADMLIDGLCSGQASLELVPLPAPSANMLKDAD
jgi:hypothetical protein